MMQRHELEAWLEVDNHGLNEAKLDELLNIAHEIEERYPDPDDGAERDAALSVAYRILLGDGQGLAGELADDLRKARTAEARALAGLRQAALSLVPHSQPESAFAREVGVDRMTVRKWLGKR